MLITNEQIQLMLWITIGFLAAMLIMIRNVFGVLSIIITGAAVFFIVLLRVGRGPGRRCVRLRVVPAARRCSAGVGAAGQAVAQAGAAQSDADQLAWLTGVPALGWVTVFGMVSLAALVGGGALLLGRW